VRTTCFENKFNTILRRWSAQRTLPLIQLAESLPAAKGVSRTAKQVAKNYKKIIEHLEKNIDETGESGEPASE